MTTQNNQETERLAKQTKQAGANWLELESRHADRKASERLASAPYASRIKQIIMLQINGNSNSANMSRRKLNHQAS
jgi:hypothetical protein